MTYTHYALEKELLHRDIELRAKCLNQDDNVWGLCIAMACKDKTKEGCAFFNSESYDSVFVTLYKDLVRGTLIKEIPLNTSGDPCNDVFVAISSLHHMLMKYHAYKERKLSIYEEDRIDDYDGCTMPEKNLYLLIE